MSTTEDTRKERVEDGLEIRLSDIVQFLKDSRRTVLWCMIAFLVLGVLYSVSKPNEYTTTIRVMPELKSAAGTGGLGDLKSLAGLAGVNLDNASTPEAIRPDLYPDIVQSVPFTLHLLSQPVVTSGQKKPYPLQDFLAEQGKNAFLGRLMGGGEAEKPVTDTAPGTGGTLQLTKLQEGLSRQLNQQVSASIDKKSGIMLITSSMPDPTVSALVAQHTLDHLTKYVTDYRTGKARQQVNFLNHQVTNARQRYQATEYALSAYRDRNRSLFLNTAKIEEQRLQADFLLAQTVYSDLSKQLEQARIKVQEEAPVFEVLEPARVPLMKSGPKRAAITIAFTLFGALLGLGVFLVRRFINPLTQSV